MDSGGGEGLWRGISIGGSVEFWIGRSLRYEVLMDGLMDDAGMRCRGGDEFFDVFVWDTSRGPKQLVCFLLKNGRRCRRR